MRVAATKYMPQRVFNVGAFAIARVHAAGGSSLDEAAARIADRYRDSFVDDSFETDWVDAATMVITAAKETWKDDELPGLFRHMQYAAANYEPDGSRRRKRILGGTWFTGEKKRNPNRVRDCLRDFVQFDYHTTLGSIPLPPDDWDR